MSVIHTDVHPPPHPLDASGRQAAGGPVLAAFHHDVRVAIEAARETRRLFSFRRAASTSAGDGPMQTTLVLTQTYRPHKVVTWQKAVTLWFLGKVEVLEEYDEEIRSVSLTI